MRIKKSYADIAQQRYEEGLGLAHFGTYDMRDELKARKWLWCQDAGCWCAPDMDERQRVAELLDGASQILSVTLHTDAGYKAGHSRIGFITRASVPPFWHSASEDVIGLANINEAEARAIRRGVETVLELFVGVGLIFIRSDNQGCVDALNSGTPKNADLKLVVELSSCVRLDVKHVKGHQKVQTRTAWMNHRADELANLRGVDVKRIAAR